jgi:hypothetical protein
MCEEVNRKKTKKPRFFSNSRENQKIEKKKFVWSSNAETEQKTQL